MQGRPATIEKMPQSGQAVTDPQMQVRERLYLFGTF